MSSNINIVLVKTSHPGNIGSSARAMKTMGLKKLTLVSPKNFPSEIADANAVGCKDILDQARVVDSLGKSLLDSSLVIGFSARSRKSNVPSLTMDELFVTLKNYENDKVSIVLVMNNLVYQTRKFNYVITLYASLQTMHIHLLI